MTTAVTITWVVLAVYAFYLGRWVIVGVSASSSRLFQGPAIPGQVSSFFNGVAVVAAVLLAWAIVAFVLSVFALAGRSWARLALVISGGLSVPFQLAAFHFFLLPLLGALGTVVGIVMLFTEDANEWYQRRT